MEYKKVRETDLFQSFIKYFLRSYYMLVILLGTGDPEEKMTCKYTCDTSEPCSHRAYNLVWNSDININSDRNINYRLNC